MRTHRFDQEIRFRTTTAQKEDLETEARKAAKTVADVCREAIVEYLEDMKARRVKRWD